MLTSDSSIKWIESLAEQERSILAGERPSLDLGRTKEDVLAVATAIFVRQLHSHFVYLIKLFNNHVSDCPSLQIRLSRPEEQFDSVQLTRHNIVLSVFGHRPGLVQIQCLKQGEANGVVPGVLFSGHLEARFALFNDVQWFFLGNPISSEQVARHYLTEFIQTSRISDSLS